MPNGAYNPQCGNCDSFRYRRNGRCCRTHRFIMPALSELICTDYTHAGTTTSFTDSLAPGELYYYSYASAAPPQSLGGFAELQAPLFHVQIRSDTELGWVMYTQPNDPFPDVDHDCTLVIEQQIAPFRVVERERTLATGGTRLADKSWKTSYTTQVHRLLVSMNDPLLLRDWLGTLFDLDANDTFIHNHEMREMVESFGIYALVKIVTPLTTYMVIPDFIQHIATFRRV